MSTPPIAIIRTRTCRNAALVSCILILLAGTFFFVSVTQAYGQKAGDTDKAAAQYEEKWGLRPLGLQLSAGGYMLDFRYCVTDGEKATPLFKPEIKPYLVIQASGERLSVAETQRFGALRQTRKPDSDKDYYIIFGNPARRVKKGDTVTVVIGELEIKDLAVR